MPFEIDDAAMDKFVALPLEKRKLVFSRLDPEALTAIEAYTPGYKERRTAAKLPQTQISAAPEDMVSREPPGLHSSATPEMLERDANKRANEATAAAIEKPFKGFANDVMTAPVFNQPASQPIGIIDSASAVIGAAKKNFIDPPVEAFQENVGRPMLESYIEKIPGRAKEAANVDRAIAGAVRPISSTAADYLERSAAGTEALADPYELQFRQWTAWLGGEKLPELMDEKKRLNAINLMEEKLGVTGSAAMQFSAEMANVPNLIIGGAGKIPAMYKAATESGAIAKLGPTFVKQYPLLATMLVKSAGKAGNIFGGVTEGVIYGAGQSLITPGQNPVEAGAFGGALGGGVGGLREGLVVANEARKLIKPKALFAMTQDAVMELASDFANAFRASKTPAVAGAPASPFSKVELSAIENPSFVVWSVEGGKPHAQVHEVVGGKSKVAELDLTDVKNQFAVGDLIRKKNLSASAESPTAARTFANLLDENAFVRVHRGSGEAPALDLTVGGKKQRIELPVDDDNYLRPFPKDALVMEDGGKLKVVPVDDAPKVRPNQPFKNGDGVYTLGKAGKKVAGVVKGIDAEGDYVVQPARGGRAKKVRASELNHLEATSDKAPAIRGDDEKTGVLPKAPAEKAPEVKAEQVVVPDEVMLDAADYAAIKRIVEFMDLTPRSRKAVAKGTGIRGDVVEQHAYQMEAEGWLERNDKGQLFLTPDGKKHFGVKEPPPTDAIPIGKVEWVDMSPREGVAVEGRGQHLYRFVEVDPKKPGHVIIDNPVNMKRESVDGTKVHPLEPPGAAKGPLVPPTPPLPNLDKAPMTPEQINLIKSFSDVADAALTRGADYAEKFLGTVLPPHLRGGHDLSLKLIQLQSAKELSRITAEFKQVKEQLKKTGVGINSNFDRDLAKLAEGRIDPTYMESTHPREWAQMRQTFEPLLKEVAALDASIQQLGGVSTTLGEMRAAGEMEMYLARMYRAYFLPDGEWAKLFAKDKLAVDGAVTFLINEYNAASKGKNIPRPQAVRKELLEILRSKNAIEELEKRAGMSSSSIPASWNNLRNRQTLPEPLKKMLGEETSGTIRLLQTVGSQRAIEANLRVWNELVKMRVPSKSGVGTENPWWSPVEHTGWVHESSGNKLKYGPVAGGFVHPLVADALGIGKPDAIPRWVHGINGWLKGNEVAFNPAAWWNATMGNVKNSLISGGLDLMRPLESGQSLVESLRLVLSRKPEVALTEMRRVGADIGGIAETEITGQQDLVLKELKKTLGKLGPDADFFDYVSVTKEALGSLVSKPREVVAHFYDTIDRTFRLANYISLKKKYLARGMDTEAAAITAGQQIQKWFPNARNPVPLAKTIRKVPFLGARYATFLAEDIRVDLTTLNDMVGGLKDLKNGLPTDRAQFAVRNLGNAAIIMGAFTGVQELRRRLGGISDQEVDAAKAVMTDRSQTRKKFLIAKPYKDSEGRVDFWDLAPFMGWTGHLLDAHPDDNPAAAVFANLMTMTVGGNVLEDPLRKMAFEDTGLLRPTDYQMRTREHHKGAKKFLMNAWNASWLPKAPVNVGRAMERGGIDAPLLPSPNTLTAEKLNTRQMILAAIGLSGQTQPVSIPGVTPGQYSPTHLANVNEKSFDIYTMEKDINAAAEEVATQMKRSNPNVTPEEIHTEVMKTIQPMLDRIKLNAQKLKTMQSKVQNLQRR